ncbi:FkbM family methyltransferase [Streptomyces sp. M2CJ-2]|uniref:FkbM family methyltransferase n=1 Tax=Streptomyces sp. M2CJ-2 TaxID=2803948 RepID=UPI0019256421|nr:FkbM family methyltransferase [Streptomyces sp. M2CJ-2]MBL3669888.1 FkbM family methyltransferase [Streptomyces sp. M2CJ-2]
MATGQSSIVEYSLPDGRKVNCTNRFTASVVCREFAEGSYADCVSRLRPGDTVIDVGAHVGLISLLLAKEVSDLRVIACEPAPPSFECLTTNFARHLPRGTAVNVAVGSESRDATLTYYPYSEVMSTVFVDEDDDRRTLEAGLTSAGVKSQAERDGFISLCRSDAIEFPVRMVTLTDLFDEYGVSDVGLLKVDVERAELEVLRGIDDKYWPSIRTVAAEVHNIDGRLEATASLLKEKGFRLHNMSEELYANTSLHMITASRVD